MTAKSEFTAQCALIDNLFVFIWLIDETDNIEAPENIKNRQYQSLFKKNKYNRLDSLVTPKTPYKIEGELRSSLKALLFIALYNLLEGTVTRLLNDCFEKVSSSKCSYSQLAKQYKAIWIKYKYKSFKSPHNDKIADVIENISNDIFSIDSIPKEDKTISNYDAYSDVIGKNNEISGNIDSRKIRELFCLYGLDIPKTKYPDRLLTVKTQRNYLAHGDKSLLEVGKQYTVEQLFEFKEVVCNCLEECIAICDDFTNNDRHKQNKP